MTYRKEEPPMWEHKTSLTPPLLTGVPVPSHESERSCKCVRGIYFSSV
jgi:hypothetical protein